MMAGFYNHLDNKEVIRVNVKKYDGRTQPEFRKFSIDPQITSFDMLRIILAKAFDVNSDFTISYLAYDTQGEKVFLSMLSDWDMDAAFQSSADPCLTLRVDLRPFEELEDWDVIAPAEVPQQQTSSWSSKNSILGSITHSLGKTVESMQRAIGLKSSENEHLKPLKAPMNETEFLNYFDSTGCMIKPDEFRKSIYLGGIEPNFRRVVWRHLLNIYPAGMSREDRLNYLKHKEDEYRKLRDGWKEKFNSGTAAEEVDVVCMVKKDVLRTDRSHDFFAGSEENKNTLSLLHILVTYALTHPDVSYCQGMSDLASPLLVTQKNEGQAYICFCALMERLRENFTIEGASIMTKFHHLSELLYMYDPVLFAHLLQNSAGDMLFCYRWFLLEVKREFPLNDALLVLEVMWATLPPNPLEHELALVDAGYFSRLLPSSPCTPSHSFLHPMYTKLRTMRPFGSPYSVSKSTTSIASPTPRASTNNNLSTDSSLHSCDLNITNNAGSCSNIHSPEKEVDDSFRTNLDTSVISSFQQSSNTDIGKQRLCERCNHEKMYNIHQEDQLFGCQTDIMNDNVNKMFAFKSTNIQNDSEYTKFGYNSINIKNKNDDGMFGYQEDNMQNNKEGNVFANKNFIINNNKDKMLGYKSGIIMNNNEDEILDYKDGIIMNDNEDEILACKCDIIVNDNDDKVFGSKDDLIGNDNSWLFTNFNYSCSSGSHELQGEQCSIYLDLDHEGSTEDISGCHVNNLGCEMNLGRRSWSLNSIASTSSERENQQSQFTLSVDSHANNSTDISSVTVDLNNIASSTETSKGKHINYVQPESNDIVSSVTDRDCFQGLRLLVGSPKQQALSSTWKETDSLSLPRKSFSFASKHLPLKRVMSSDKASLTKNMSGSHISDCQEATEEFGSSLSSSTTKPSTLDPSKLPPPQEFGAGNPFLMFLCLTLLLQHRETILTQDLCYEEVAMYFDRLVRRHNAHRVLHMARQMYTEYLRAQQVRKKQEQEDDEKLSLHCSGIFNTS